MDFEQIQEELSQASTSVEILKRQITAFFETVPDPFFIMDSKGNYLEILGGNAHQLYNDGTFLKGKNVKDIFNQDLSEFFISTIADVINSKQLKIVEYEMTPQHLLGDVDFESNWYEGRVTAIQDLIGEIKAVVWIAINITEKKKLENQLKDLSEKDPLTGLYNRRYFEKEIIKQFSRCKRYKEILSVAFIDIDYFKKVNDNYGHDIGDEVLKNLANLVVPQLRVNDLFARFGGEEFILLLPNTSQDAALQLLERLRLLIKDHNVETGRGKISFTISIGITEITDHDIDYHTMVKRADEALYKAKEGGRDQVVIS